MPISEPEAAKAAIMPLYAWAAVGEMLPAVVPVIPTSALRAFGVQFRCTVVFNHYKPNARAREKRRACARCWVLLRYRQDEGGSAHAMGFLEDPRCPEDIL